MESIAPFRSRLVNRLLCVGASAALMGITCGTSVLLAAEGQTMGKLALWSSLFPSACARVAGCRATEMLSGEEVFEAQVSSSPLAQNLALRVLRFASLAHFHSIDSIVGSQPAAEGIRG